MTDTVTPNSKPTDDFAIALSGGGHRASLLALGGLTALVDRGLNCRVARISSVSGGSLTNGVIAARCDFRTVGVSDFEEVASSFSSAVRSKSLYAVWWIVVKVAIGTLAAPVALAIWTKRPWTLALSFVTAALMLTGIGRWLRKAIERRHFPDGVTLRTVQATNVIHHFCATDLVTGMPVTFTTGSGLAGRWVPLPPGERGWAVQLHRPHDERLATVVRASAAFPGIPPKAIRFSEHGVDDTLHSATIDPMMNRIRVDLSRWAFCADGGIWNNLGTQGLREHGSNRGLPILCINASAPAKPSRTIAFWIPGIGVAMSLFRTMTTLSRNTVEPRVDMVQRDLERRHHAGTAPNASNDPLTVIADMQRVMDAFARLNLVSTDGDIEFADGTRSSIPQAEIEAVATSPSYQAWRDSDQEGEIRVATTLSKIRANEAFVLLLRGYVGTWLASLHLQAASPAELTSEHGRAVLERLRRIAHFPNV